MIHNHLALGLTALHQELALFVGPNPYSEESIRSFVPVGMEGITLRPGGSGCYLAVMAGRNYSTIWFELILNGAVLDRPEALALSGKFTDMRYQGDRYKGWYRSPHSHPYLLDILDRVDRMAAYAILRVEQAAQEALGNPDFRLLPILPANDLYKVLEYFREPVQLDGL